MRRPDLGRLAIAAAMSVRKLLVVDSFINVENTLSRRITVQMGFKERGVVPKMACYNGVLKDVMWHEITRADLGLEDV